MKILIIATPRSGSTVLARTLGDLFKLKVFFEPFLSNYIGEKYINKGPHIIKTMVWDIETSTFNFDAYTHIIYLTRKDIKQSAESYSYQLNTNLNNPGNWHKKYYISKSLNIENEYKLLKEGYDTLHKLSDNIVYYEDIYSGDKIRVEKTFKKIGLEIDYNKIQSKINPLRRYRMSKIEII